MRVLLVIFILLVSQVAQARHSTARQWNEVLLESIRNDLSRPTVHARNLFHVSAAMYDAWAVFSDQDKAYLLGNEVHGFVCPFDGFPFDPAHTKALRKEAVSFAAYRLILHRFGSSPGRSIIYHKADSLLSALGYDPAITSTHYRRGSAAALGNYIALQYIEYGLSDGCNERNDYASRYYEPLNPPMKISGAGNPGMVAPNHWQPIRFDTAFDENGELVIGGVRKFLSPEWGWVDPFSLQEEDKIIRVRDGFEYAIYHDPGTPPMLDTLTGKRGSDLYKWNFALVSIWAADLEPRLDVKLDISPASLGDLDIDDFPSRQEDFDQFYTFIGGSDPSNGHYYNPATGRPYQPQIVKLGDYARVLAEFWADGPDSETPPGHWVAIMNEVLEHPKFTRQIGGQGLVLDPLEYDVKAYFLLCGALHDVAVACWSVKGYYDYVRPVSAIRYMAEKGQSSDSGQPAYHVAGIPLVEGYIERVDEDDPLAGPSNENLNKIKLYTWKGPDHVANPAIDAAGVGWILAEDWWPYQSPTFVTPPFAGYVSGHSTYSRAAAEVLTRLTGDTFFPGGIAEFTARKDEFLTFEDGPSTDIILQWATYRDAADQSSLSRIWGGIHPPADDIPGRLMGEKIGNQAFEYGISYFSPATISGVNRKISIRLYPNPATESFKIDVPANSRTIQVELRDMMGRLVLTQTFENDPVEINIGQLRRANYLVTVSGTGFRASEILTVQ